MRCENSPDNDRRCGRSASKIIIIKDTNDVKQQSKLWICNECFNEKLFNDRLFKDDPIQVLELNN
jgi:hypothetical protein